jgi:hypothetical protein
MAACARHIVNSIIIKGITIEGSVFRPSDWAERLCGAMSAFAPMGWRCKDGICYSPYCVPRFIDGIKCVVVNPAIRDIEVMAWDFVMHFARDNNLVVLEPA